MDHRGKARPHGRLPVRRCIANEVTATTSAATGTTRCARHRTSATHGLVRLPIRGLAALAAVGDLEAARAATRLALRRPASCTGAERETQHVRIRVVIIRLGEMELPIDVVRGEAADHGGRASTKEPRPAVHRSRRLFRIGSTYEAGEGRVEQWGKH